MQIEPSSFVAGSGVWIWSDQTPSFNIHCNSPGVTVEAAGCRPVRNVFNAEPSPPMPSGNAKLAAYHHR